MMTKKAKSSIENVINHHQPSKALSKVISRQPAAEQVSLVGLATTAGLQISGNGVTDQNYPFTGFGTQPQLFHFDQDMKSTEVFASIDRLDLRPATAHDLVRYAQAHPSSGLDFPIAALGSISTDSFQTSRVLCLWEITGPRVLAQNYWSTYWGDRKSVNYFFNWSRIYRFLAVRR